MIHPIKNIIKKINSRDAHWTIQFVKYGIAGCTAAGFDIVIFSLLAWKLFPALKDDELVVKLFNLDIPDVAVHLRAWYYIIDKTIAFMISNFIAYVINIYWVFTPGRHSRRKEIILFYIVSIVSFVLGTSVGALLIRYFNFSGLMAYVSNTVAAVMINYAGRKFLIFQK